jgi:putative copper export protein
MHSVCRISTIVALLAAAIWLGGLVALGAVAAPVVFALVSWPQNADAMSVVFRRFDTVAMACAAVVVATEAVRAVTAARASRLALARRLASLLAALAAIVEGVSVSPRIAALHASGATRGAGAAGLELSRLHGLAETLGKTEVLLLAAVIALHVLTLPAPLDVVALGRRPPG